MNVIYWWYFMIAIAIINILIISFNIKNVNSKFEMNIFILAFIFVFVNSIRSIWLREDIQRLCLHNNLISSPLVGRIITTFSELSFALLIVLIFKKIVNRSNHNPAINIVLDLVFIAIIIAEVFCWKGCLSTNQFWNMLEESTWAFSAFIITIVSIVLLFKEKNLTIRKFLIVTIIATICYEIFMVKVDIPMYIKRSNNITTNAKGFFSQLYDMYNCKIVSKSNKYWDEEMPWLTGYFTFGSWLAIALVMWYQSNRKLF